MTRGKGAAAVAIALGVLIGGCGDSGDDSGEPQPPSELARLVPQGAFGSIVEADFAAAREALGLPADFDPRDGLDATGAEHRFAEAVTPTVPFYVGPQPIPLAKALDGGRIEAAAAEGRGGASEVILIRTSQPFDEIASALAKDGYKRVGRILNFTGNVNEVRYPEVVASEDGETIAISGERTRGFATLGKGPAAPDARPELALLGELPPAPVRTAEDTVIGADCASIAIADELADGEGELLVEVSESQLGAAPSDETTSEPPEASEDALLLGDQIEGFELGQVEVSGESLRAPFTFSLDAEGAPGTAVLDAFGDEIYDCPARF